MILSFRRKLTKKEDGGKTDKTSKQTNKQTKKAKKENHIDIFCHLCIHLFDIESFCVDLRFK